MSKGTTNPELDLLEGFTVIALALSENITHACTFRD